MQRYDETKNVSNASSTEGFGFQQKKCRVHISRMVKKKKKSCTCGQIPLCIDEYI